MNVSVDLQTQLREKQQHPVRHIGHLSPTAGHRIRCQHSRVQTSIALLPHSSVPLSLRTLTRFGTSLGDSAANFHFPSIAPGLRQTLRLSPRTSPGPGACCVNNPNSASSGSSGGSAAQRIEEGISPGDSAANQVPHQAEGGEDGSPAQDMDAPNRPHLHQGPHSALSFVNESTKWVVSCASGLFLLLDRDASVMWCLLGSIMASFVNKALKRVINVRRPANSRKGDPGMPSSHANSLAFLATYCALALLSPVGPTSSSLSSQMGAAALMAAAFFLTWLRVALGYHTYPQVLVGFCLGSASAVGWLHLGGSYVLPALSLNPGYRKGLMGVTYVAAAAFAVRNLLPWLKGILRLRQEASAERVTKRRAS